MSRVDRKAPAGDLGEARVQRGLGAQRVGVRLGGVELEQEIAGPDRLALVDMDRRHLAGIERLDHLGVAVESARSGPTPWPDIRPERLLGVPAFVLVCEREEGQVWEGRKLVAILVSDVVGYSRLAGADEDRILARLRTLRSDLIDPIIAVHQKADGRDDDLVVGGTADTFEAAKAAALFEATAFLRALKENARQGFWNGSLPPIGYRVIAAEQRGAKAKKKLEIDPLHADTVRLIYRLALEGDGTSGSMGVKNIATYLNQHRIFTRDGGRWGIGQVHRILTRPTYIGRHEFNKRAKNKVLKPTSEIVTVAVPPLIDQTTFDAVQSHLRVRNPKVTPARVVSGPTLLTGICFCADCGGAMTLRTGKGGRYRYYTCSIKARQGETGCKGRSIPMEKLDNLVVEHLADRLLQPERLEEVLASVLDRR